MPPRDPPSADAFGEVNVDVMDRDGRPVAGLRKEDFEVFEDGKRVEVTNFRAVAPEARPASLEDTAPAPSPQVEAGARFQSWRPYEAMVRTTLPKTPPRSRAR